MTFTAGNLFPSHVLSPHQDSNRAPQLERRTTYQLSYPPPFVSLALEMINIELPQYSEKMTVECISEYVIFHQYDTESVGFGRGLTPSMCTWCYIVTLLVRPHCPYIPISCTLAESSTSLWLCHYPSHVP